MFCSPSTGVQTFRNAFRTVAVKISFNRGVRANSRVSTTPHAIEMTSSLAGTSEVYFKPTVLEARGDEPF